MSTVRTQILLTPALHKKSKLIGIATGKSLSELVRTALGKYIEAWDKKQKAQKKNYILSNVIGSVNLNDSGWKNINIRDYQKEIRKDKL